jgi:hypothetical protein
MAEATGGQYHDAQSEEDIQQAVDQAIAGLPTAPVSPRRPE